MRRGGDNPETTRSRAVGIATGIPGLGIDAVHGSVGLARTGTVEGFKLANKGTKAVLGTTGAVVETAGDVTTAAVTSTGHVSVAAIGLADSVASGTLGTIRAGIERLRGTADINAAHNLGTKQLRALTGVYIQEINKAILVTDRWLSTKRIMDAMEDEAIASDRMKKKSFMARSGLWWDTKSRKGMKEGFATVVDDVMDRDILDRLLASRRKLERLRDTVMSIVSTIGMSEIDRSGTASFSREDQLDSRLNRIDSATLDRKHALEVELSKVTAALKAELESLNATIEQIKRHIDKAQLDLRFSSRAVSDQETPAGGRATRRRKRQRRSRTRRSRSRKHK